MVNDIQVCSNALVLIGDSPITTWADSDGGTAAEKFYPTTKKALLSCFPWTFALKTFQLNKLTEVPPTETGFSKMHKLPTDMLRLWRLLPEGIDYIIHENNVLSNTDELLAEYIYDPQENNYSDAFREALEYIMASKLAMSVTENFDVAQLMLAQHQNKIREARHLDATQRPTRAIVDAPFNAARLGGKFQSINTYA